MTEATTSSAQPLLTPREGTPEPIDTVAGLAEAARRLAAGTGPVAIDAERASGYRYTGRAYLVQLRRAGSGTLLIDPLPFDDLAPIAAAMADAEWIVHAATQDLACLAEVGLHPTKLFDTELGGRLAGFERVSLAIMVERLLGFCLEKGHSAADWSTRPLPAAWLTYAALDVELLLELRDAIATELENQGKLEWALEEFAAVAVAKRPARRQDPWRRTSGIHQVRTAAGLARVRALWEARDEVARRRDCAPGRVLPDSAIVSAAAADPDSEQELFKLPVYGGRATRRLATTWLRALRKARELPDSELPGSLAATDGPPPGYRWADRDPVAAKRLTGVRETLTELAQQHRLPVENLLTPDIVRRLAWQPPQSTTPEALTAALSELGARNWQIDLTATPLSEALIAATSE